MSRVYFEEVQKFRDKPWIWILAVLISIASLLPLVNRANVQLIRGDQWGNTPVSNTSLILLIAFISVCWAVLIFMLFSIKLEVTIDDEGIRYRFYPIMTKMDLITMDQITEYKLEKRFRFFDAGGIGYHRNKLRNTKAFRISGHKHLFLRLKDNSRIRIGTQNLEGIEWAMNRLMKKNENF